MPRKAKSIDLHLIDGNKGHKTKKEIEQRKNSEQLLNVGADKVEPPEWLSLERVELFNRLAGELNKIKLVTNVDVFAMARWCDAMVDYIECSKIIATEGLMVSYTNKAAETNQVPHPLLTKKKQLNEQMAKLESEFGLTPAARAKLAMPPKEEKEPTEFEKAFGEL